MSQRTYSYLVDSAGIEIARVRGGIKVDASDVQRCEERQGDRYQNAQDERGGDEKKTRKPDCARHFV